MLSVQSGDSPGALSAVPSVGIFFPSRRTYPEWFILAGSVFIGVPRTAAWNRWTVTYDIPSQRAQLALKVD